MTIRIGDLQGEIRSMEFPWNGDVVKLSYKAGMITADFEDEVQTLVETKRTVGAAATFLSELLVEWDVQDNEKNPWPPTLEHLRTLAYTFTDRLVSAIVTDAGESQQPPNGHSEEPPPPNRAARRARN